MESSLEMCEAIYLWKANKARKCIINRGHLGSKGILELKVKKIICLRRICYVGGGHNKIKNVLLQDMSVACVSVLPS